MTLLVGILCADGVVIASDRQATHGALGQMTVGQAVTKVQIVNENALFATSGAVGLGQQLAHVVDKHHGQFVNLRYPGVATALQPKFRELIDPAMKTAGLAMQVIGGAARNDAVCGCLLAAHCKDGLFLAEVSPQANIERLSKDLSFVCCGSGKQNADPFLGFIKGIYFPTSLPSIAEGVVAAHWTVKHAIDLKSPGVGFDCDLFVMENGKKARQLSPDELKENARFFSAAEDAMRAVLKPPPANATGSPSQVPTLPGA